jgi:hypothetical protein
VALVAVKVLVEVYLLETEPLEQQIKVPREGTLSFTRWAVAVVVPVV